MSRDSEGWSEEWLANRIAKGKTASFPQVKSAPEFSAAVKVEKPVGKPRGETLRLILPFKLPTWNRLLAMNQWERARVRHWIHRAVSQLSPTEEDSQTLTVSPSRLLSMGLSIEEYYAMITPRSSPKYGVGKCRARKSRPSLK